ncbi:MAG: hypothetical protein JSU65_08600 [Candidatus Zixiibacteriota bacterium]|nr:MAG: hypothetical protein JSU65_08600 [candidate division Zixibacteria bacterium]
MVYEYFCHVGFKIEEPIAELLFTAIMTDTGRFRFGSTTRRTLEIAGELIEAGADPRKTCDQVYFSLSPAAMRLMGKVLDGIEFVQDNKFCLLKLTRDMLEQTGAQPSEAEGLVDYTLFARGVKAGALLRAVDDNCTKLSLRSQDGIDVASIASRYGGGGHAAAAGCIMKLPLQEARDEIVRCFVEVYGKSN